MSQSSPPASTPAAPSSPATATSSKPKKPRAPRPPKDKDGAPIKSERPSGKGSRGPYKRKVNPDGTPIAPAAKKAKKSAGGKDKDRSESRAGSEGSTSRQGTPAAGGKGGDAVDDVELVAREKKEGEGEDGEDGEGEEEEEDDEMDTSNNRDLETRRRIDRVRGDQMLLVQHLDPIQRDRFDHWKVAAFPKAAIKKYIQSSTSYSIGDDLAQIVGGVSKVYVGIMVGRARQVQASWNQMGPLTASHLREAHRLFLLESAGAVRPGNGVKKKSLFVR